MHPGSPGESGPLCCITVLCSVSDIGVTEESSVGAFLHLQVKHSLLLSVINACDTRKVTLLIIEFHFIYNIYGDILKGNLLVGSKEVLTLHKYSVYSLSVYCNCSILSNLDSGIFLYEFLQH